jgi:hypothetical protein
MEDLLDGKRAVTFKGSSAVDVNTVRKVCQRKKGMNH